ncbi:hypothetical protein SO3561_09410 [Streptomyces olivochromogenes]|uniref:Uncharacterized protein n=1 Tax=Streptomyces olivochromogenes TaxID=1963 RepID=A0A250VV52_STROL|nr:hypothetical protein SO3561_09410 [Streptomyces olivochromogenes]
MWSTVRRESYSQLRAHLSYPKLNDAFEALPRVLDQVRTENLSMAAAFERLLEIEVEPSVSWSAWSRRTSSFTVPPTTTSSTGAATTAR